MNYFKLKQDFLAAIIIAVIAVLTYSVFSFGDMDAIRQRHDVQTLIGYETAAITQDAIVAAPNQNPTFTNEIVVDRIQLTASAPTRVYLSYDDSGINKVWEINFPTLGGDEDEAIDIKLPAAVALDLTSTATATLSYTIEYHYE